MGDGGKLFFGEDIRKRGEGRYYIILKKTGHIRVAMAVTDDLETDQRVARHAEALQEAGCEVTVIGRELPESRAVAFGFAAERMALRHRRGWKFYAEYNRRVASRIAALWPDVVWANDTDTLVGCWVASKRCGARLVLDCHELFPEVPEIQGKPFVRWVWTTVERLLMPRCDARLTVCQSIADYYGRRYGVEMAVVRNVPSGKWRVESGKREAESGKQRVLLYQGAVNVGRGVDWAIDALEWLPECRLVVAGDGDLLEQMKSYAAGKAWAERVSFLGRVSPAELREITAKADVGLVMLEDMGLSYHYALPNRIGDFVVAGVPMVVSDLPEMAAVVRGFDIGEVIDGTGAKALAAAVERLLGRWGAMDAGQREARFGAAREDMDWEMEKEKLVELIIES